MREDVDTTCSKLEACNRRHRLMQNMKRVLKRKESMSRQDKQMMSRKDSDNDMD